MSSIYSFLLFSIDLTSHILNLKIDKNSMTGCNATYIDLNDSKSYQFNVLKTQRAPFNEISPKVKDQTVEEQKIYEMQNCKELFKRKSFSIELNDVNLLEGRYKTDNVSQIYKSDDKYNCPLKIIKEGVCCSELFCPVRSYFTLIRKDFHTRP